MNTLNNLKDFNDYINTLASEWDSEQGLDLHDFCIEQADNSEYLIYRSKAWDLVNMIRNYDYSLLVAAEDAIEYSDTQGINNIMQVLAYEIIYQSLFLSVQEINSK